MKRHIFLITVLFTSIFISCDDIVMEDDISEELVHLIAPAEDAEFNSTGITFTWNPVENGTQYRIQIAKPSFAEALQIVVDATIDTTSFTTQLNIGDYEWRVQAVNSSYSTSYSTRSFKIINNEDFQSNSVTLSSPSDNLITNLAVQNLNWQPVIGATGYQVQVINTSNGSVVNEEDVSGTSYNYTFPQGTYFWKVRATNGSQNTLYSTRSILIDTTVPHIPNLITPGNLSNTSDNDVVFSWARTPVLGSTEKDSIYIFTNSTLTALEYKNEESSPYNTATLSNGTYYWFVKSFDEAGNTSQQSAVFSFTLN